MASAEKKRQLPLVCAVHSEGKLSAQLYRTVQKITKAEWLGRPVQGVLRQATIDAQTDQCSMALIKGHSLLLSQLSRLLPLE